MSITRRVMLSATATTLVAGALIGVSPAQAAQTPLALDAAVTLAESLGGDQSAGSYVDSSGALVINVTDAAAASKVKAAGGQARVVQRSSADLASLSASLDKGVVGTALVRRPGHQPGRRRRRRHRHRCQVGRAAERRVRQQGRGPDREDGRQAEPHHLRWRRHLHRRLALLARLQRAGRHDQLLPDRRALHQRRDHVDQRQRDARHPRRHQLPGQRLRDRPLHQHDDRQARRRRQRRTSPPPATRPSASGSPAAAAPPAPAPARCSALNATVNYPQGSVSGMIRTNVCAAAGRQRRLALRRQRGSGPDLRWQRQLHQRRHDLLPAGHRAAERLRRIGLLKHALPLSPHPPRTPTAPGPEPGAVARLPCQSAHRGERPSGGRGGPVHDLRPLHRDAGTRRRRAGPDQPARAARRGQPGAVR